MNTYFNWRKVRWPDPDPALFPLAITRRMLEKPNQQTLRRWPFSDSEFQGTLVSQPPLLEGLLTRPPIFELIFSIISPASLIRFARTCRLARNAVFLFSERAFNINKHLYRFFANPVDFRSLQARTGTLISGSSVLQFLDRTFYPDSDLDLYTHPGHAKEVGLWLIQHEGYTFKPSEIQLEENPDLDFDSVDWPSWRPWDMTFPRTDVDWDDLHDQSYRVSGLDGVYHFEKPSPSGGPALQVQIMAAEHTPLQCIFNFHSTCVMNFITFDAAYSLYPRATFEERRSLSLASLKESDIRCLSKYAVRGWASLSDIWPHETGAQTTFYMDRHRWVGDGFSWVVPLDTAGVEFRSQLSPVSEPFAWDPVQYNSWWLMNTAISSKIFMSYHIFKPTLFRYTYLFADLKLISNMSNFVREQGKLEHTKTVNVPEDMKEVAWTWWDSVLPDYVRRYLEKLSHDSMDTT